MPIIWGTLQFQLVDFADLPVRLLAFLTSERPPSYGSAAACRAARPLKRTALLAKPMNGINAPQRPDCVAECAVLSEPVSGSLPPLLVPVIYIFSGTKIYAQGR